MAGKRTHWQYFQACLLIVTFWAKPVFATQQVKAFSRFGELRHHLLDLIGSATTRVWLATDYLTDGEIVAALYVAQYRKIDVKVLLGKPKANHYMSRLSFLKRHRIPVFLKPMNFRTEYPSALLVDQKVYFVDGELDFLANYSKFHLKSPIEPQSGLFVKDFALAINAKIPALLQQQPPVSARPRYRRLPRPSQQGSLKDETSDTYTYPVRRQPPPQGVATDLPSATVQEVNRMRHLRKATPVDETRHADQLDESEHIEELLTPPGQDQDRAMIRNAAGVPEDDTLPGEKEKK